MLTGMDTSTIYRSVFIRPISACSLWWTNLQLMGVNLHFMSQPKCHNWQY